MVSIPYRQCLSKETKMKTFNLPEVSIPYRQCLSLQTPIALTTRSVQVSIPYRQCLSEVHSISKVISMVVSIPYRQCLSATCLPLKCAGTSEFQFLIGNVLAHTPEQRTYQKHPSVSIPYRQCLSKVYGLLLLSHPSRVSIPYRQCLSLRLLNRRSKTKTSFNSL